MHFLKKIDIRIYAVLISFLFSWLAYCHATPINNDGILYLSDAQTFLQNGFQSALHLYSWPFYAIFIAYVSHFTHLALIPSAFAINAVSTAVLITAFLSIIRIFDSQSRALQVLAAITILFFPSLNGIRDLVVRDFAYWALIFLGFWQLLLFNQNYKFFHVMIWFLCTAIAIAFRIEAIFLLVALPFFLLFSRDNLATRVNTVLKIYLLPIIIILLLIVFYHVNTLISFGRLSDVVAEFQSYTSILKDTFTHKISAIQTNLLPPEAHEDGSRWFISGLIGTFLWQIAAVLTALYSLLFLHGFFKKLLPAKHGNLLLGFALINILIPLSFYLQNYYLSGRYLMPIALTLLIWVPFSLKKISESSAGGFKAFLFPFVITLAILLGFGSLIHMGHSKKYIADAGTWIQQNTPKNATLFSNSHQVLFYAKRTPIDWNDHQDLEDDEQPFLHLKTAHWQNYDYIAIVVKHESSADAAQIKTLLGKNSVICISNKRGDQVMIFKVR